MASFLIISSCLVLMSSYSWSVDSEDYYFEEGVYGVIYKGKGKL